MGKNVDTSFKNKLTNYNIRVNIFNGVAATIAANLVSPYFAKFAERLGATDFQIALLSSLPAFICIFALIPGAILIESFKNKKAVTGSIIFAHKVFYLLLALVPFVDKAYQPWLFVILVGLMNLPGSIGGMGFQSSIGDIFEGEMLGISMALRNRYATIFGMIITYLSGQIITRIPKTSSQTITLYQVLFVITFLISQAEVFSYIKFRGIKSSKKEPGFTYVDSLKEVWKNIPKERGYLIFMLCSLIFYFGWQMGWPLFNLYTIKYLKADEIWLAVISIASSLSSILTYTFWAKFASKKGNNGALYIATIGMSITPLLYVISRNLWILVFFNVLIGISVAGTSQILFNMLIEVSPAKNRTIYIAIYNTLINISAAISPVIGVSFKARFNIFTALIIVAFFRFAGSIAFFISSRYMKRFEKVDSGTV